MSRVNQAIQALAAAGIVATLLAACADPAAPPPLPATEDGYQTLHLVIHEGPDIPAWTADGACIVSSTIPPDHEWGELPQFLHLGIQALMCLRGEAPNGPFVPGWFDGPMFIRLDGECDDTEDLTHFGCTRIYPRRIDIQPLSIARDHFCAWGTPMHEYTPKCWRAFYRVLGHEIGHVLFGSFH